MTTAACTPFSRSWNAADRTINRPDRMGATMKKPAHATVVAYLSLFIAMSGTAAAATGGNFLLGRFNSENRQATLKNTTRGQAALVLLTENNKVKPFGVGTNETKVPHLNADLVDGLRTSTWSTHEITSSGSIVVPPGVTRMIIEVRGAGGGGGGAASGGNGSGGGQGGWVRVVVSVKPGAQYDVTVGQPGSGGSAGAGGRGTAGGDTYVRLHGSSADAAHATGGQGGNPGESCAIVENNGPVSGGTGGAGLTPTDADSLALQGATGNEGAGTGYMGPSCPSATVGGQDAANTAGAGGSGGDGASGTNGSPGHPGLVLVFFSA